MQAIAERELTRHGARIEYVLGGGTDSASDILLKGVKQAIAVYENYQRVERTRRGKNGRVKAGGVRSTATACEADPAARRPCSAAAPRPAVACGVVLSIAPATTHTPDSRSTT